LDHNSVGPCKFSVKIAPINIYFGEQGSELARSRKLTTSIVKKNDF